MTTKDISDFGGLFADEILDTVETPIALLDGDGKILRFNHACEALTDYSEAEAVGRKVWDFLIIESEIESVREIFAKTRTEDLPTHFTNYWKTKSGERRLLRWSNKTLRMPDGKVVSILATAIDLTALSDARRSLSENQAFLRSIIDASPVAIVTVDERGRILTFSRTAEGMFGVREQEVLNKNVNILMPKQVQARQGNFLKQHLESENRSVSGRSRRIRARRSDGEEFAATLHVNEFVDGERVFVGFFEDMTEAEEMAQRLDELQFQLRHADRVGSMGEIATSIAHELNQPLTAAASLVGAVSLRLKKGECSECKDALPLLSDAIDEVRRASEIIHQMREFVQKRRTAKSLHNINKIVEDAGALAVIGAEADGVEVQWNLAPDAGDARMDRIQIQQVITNLIRNALDAMQRAPKRVLAISTKRDVGMVEVSVADTGSGIDQKLQRNLFEPFVSSKDDGMGIGLSISKSIIDAHQGEIFATNRESGGCVFTFKLPAGADGVGEQ